MVMDGGAKPGGAGTTDVYSVASAGEPSAFLSFLFASGTGAGAGQSVAMCPTWSHRMQERFSPRGDPRPPFVEER